MPFAIYLLFVCVFVCEIDDHGALLVLLVVVGGGGGTGGSCGGGAAAAAAAFGFALPFPFNPIEMWCGCARCSRAHSCANRVVVWSRVQLVWAFVTMAVMHA